MANKAGRKPGPPEQRRIMWSRRLKIKTIEKIKQVSQALGLSETAYVEGLIDKDKQGESDDKQ